MIHGPGARTGERVLALGLACLAGVFMAAQSRMNGGLTVRWGEPLAAALWSTASGLVAVGVIVAVSPAARAGLSRWRAALRGNRLRWWQCLGGVFGGTLVAAQSWSVPLIGVALFALSIVAGQTVAAMVVDRLGWGSAPRTHISWRRIAAGVLAVAGVALASGAGGNWSPQTAVAVVVVVAVGAGSSVQAATNGRVNAHSGNVFATTLVNFTVGGAVLGVYAGVQALSTGITIRNVGAVPVWLLGGGLCGVAIIAVAAWAVAHLGVLVYLVTVLTTQVSTAVLLDMIVPTATVREITPTLVVGVVLTCTAAVVAARASAEPHPKEAP